MSGQDQQYTPRWEYDPEAGAGYLHLRHGEVEGTEAVADLGFMVDVSAAGETLGIEVVGTDDAALVDAFIAQVRRDAARDALRHAATIATDHANLCPTGCRTETCKAHNRTTAAWLRDLAGTYPEVTP